jgi:hypothetical protein
MPADMDKDETVSKALRTDIGRKHYRYDNKRGEFKEIP